MANVKKINGYDLIDSKSDYSTSEIDTGKKWIDGKTIYRKVIDTGVLSPVGTTGVLDVAHGITNLGEVVNLKCYAYNASGTCYSAPYATITGGHTVTMMLTINSTNIRFVFRDGVDDEVPPVITTRSYTIVEYTKSA